MHIAVLLIFNVCQVIQCRIAKKRRYIINYETSESIANLVVLSDAELANVIWTLTENIVNNSTFLLQVCSRREKRTNTLFPAFNAQVFSQLLTI